MNPNQGHFRLSHIVVGFFEVIEAALHSPFGETGWIELVNACLECDDPTKHHGDGALKEVGDGRLVARMRR